MLLQMQLLNLLKCHHFKKLKDEIGTFLLAPQQEIKESMDIRFYLIYFYELAGVVIADQLVEQIIDLHALFLPGLLHLLGGLGKKS